MNLSPVIWLPRYLQNFLEAGAHKLLKPPEGVPFDFSQPLGEQALLAPDSISWRICKNPVVLLMGGITAVLLELAEPAVRAGVWLHTSFRTQPMHRLQRTGLAAMITVYGARSIAEPMIARVVRLHARVQGKTPEGLSYAASDPRLLCWVQVTALFGFSEAYSRYVQPLSQDELDLYYRESVPASTLYGVLDAPASTEEVRDLFAMTRDRLEPSAAVFEFLHLMKTMRGLPGPLCWLQGAIVRAAVELLPDWVRDRLGLTEQYGLRRGEQLLVSAAAALADRICLVGGPPAQACLRLGLSPYTLYR